MVNQKAVAYWDKYVKKSKKKVYMNFPRRLEWEKIREVFDINSRDYPIIGELGVGSGHFAVNFLREGFTVWGIDISKVSLETCRKRALYYYLTKKLKLVNTDYSKEQLVNKFNAGYIISSFHCLSLYPKEQEMIFKNFIKSIKRNGKIFIMEPNPYNLLLYLEYIFLYKRYWKEGFNVIYSRRCRIIRLMKESGIDSIKVYPYAFLPTSYIEKYRFIENLNKFLCNTPVIKNFCLFNLFVGVKSLRNYKN